MKKLSILILIFILAVSSFAAYLYLTDTIFSGNQKVAEGEQQIKDGERMLAAGKARLSDGNRKLNTAKKAYRGVKSVPLIGVVSKLPVSGQVFSIAGSKIASGNQMVAKGREKVKAGEEELRTGKLELERGKAKLMLANKIRIACAVSSIIFTVLFIGLLAAWQRALRERFF